jgi:hypothetical protein
LPLPFKPTRAMDSPDRTEISTFLAAHRTCEWRYDLRRKPEITTSRIDSASSVLYLKRLLTSASNMAVSLLIFQKRPGRPSRKSRTISLHHTLAQVLLLHLAEEHSFPTGLLRQITYQASAILTKKGDDNQPLLSSSSSRAKKTSAPTNHGRGTALLQRLHSTRALWARCRAGVWRSATP